MKAVLCGVVAGVAGPGREWAVLDLRRQRVETQRGDFYGGWITPEIVGPFKGGPGSWGW